jgi:hypothetical protein
VFLLQSLIDAIHVEAEDLGAIYPKKIFSKYYSSFGSGKLCHHIRKDFFPSVQKQEVLLCFWTEKGIELDHLIPAD